MATTTAFEALCFSWFDESAPTVEKEPPRFPLARVAELADKCAVGEESTLLSLSLLLALAILSRGGDD